MSFMIVVETNLFSKMTFENGGKVEAHENL